MTSTGNPLQELEASVQRQAAALPTDTKRATEDIKTIIAAEVARWNDDVKRGDRSVLLADPARTASQLERNLLGYGPLEPLLADDDVWEIMVNAPDEIFAKRHSGPSGYHHEVFNDEEHVRRTLTRILDQALGSHRVLDASTGLQDAQLNDGSRLHIVHSDLSRGGHLMFNIRKFTGVAYRSLDELVSCGTLSAHLAAVLSAAVRSRLSILIAGAPGTGKTTLLSCCAAQLDPALRVVTAEEVFEVDVPLPNVAAMQTRPARAERAEVNLRRLVAGFLRMAPDVAIVGEVRDSEALPLLLTLSSGVTGYATIHAGSAQQALSRLRFICQLSDAASTMSTAALSHLVADAIDIVVHLTRIDGRVRVGSVLAVEDCAGGDTASFAVSELFCAAADGPDVEWSGALPIRAARKSAERGIDLPAVLAASRSSQEVS